MADRSKPRKFAPGSLHAEIDDAIKRSGRAESRLLREIAKRSRGRSKPRKPRELRLHGLIGSLPPHLTGGAELWASAYDARTPRDLRRLAKWAEQAAAWLEGQEKP